MAMLLSRGMLLEGQSAFRRAVFEQPSPTRIMAPPLSHTLRTHTMAPTNKRGGGLTERVTFYTVHSDNSAALLRYLKLWHTNCHAVVSDLDLVDFFLDMEMKCSTWLAAERVVKIVLDTFIAMLPDLAEMSSEKLEAPPSIRHILVLNASGLEGEKQSLHLHVRLDRPLSSRKDVRVITQALKRRVPSTISDWVDSQPAISGSLRVMHATTVNQIRPLVPLGPNDVSDKALSDMLQQYAPPSEDVMFDMSLIKRFGRDLPSGENPYSFEELAEGLFGVKQGNDWQAVTKKFCASTVVANGTLSEVLNKIPVEATENYEEWSRVLWCLKSIAGADTTGQLDEDVYALFDEFSSQSCTKYTPEKNLRRWQGLKRGGQPKMGWYALKKLARSLKE
eukprot:TRINITY_DN74595_c0_g1_i1.p1 TRINITY_DN74595_c0_g1~~TRINITY_DN74595_c0_g1_i1.p1  ORF type:complete len:392 (+),score=100.50 TRINITY_DN74595_c0_g1_i1:166-1341(+)